MFEISKSCLLINADPIDQAIFMEALNDVAPETFFLVANDGMEALEIMQEDCLTPDYVFVELSMPGIDGVEFLREVKKVAILKNIPVIIHSPKPVPHKVLELKEMGAFAIYFGPYSYRSICNVLNFYFQHDFKTNLN